MEGVGLAMRDELNQSAVLAMYDVRGIQSYIFRTNEVREIIGASNKKGVVCFVYN